MKDFRKIVHETLRARRIQKLAEEGLEKAIKKFFDSGVKSVELRFNDISKELKIYSEEIELEKIENLLEVREVFDAIKNILSNCQQMQEKFYIMIRDFEDVSDFSDFDNDFIKEEYTGVIGLIFIELKR